MEAAGVELDRNSKPGLILRIPTGRESLKSPDPAQLLPSRYKTGTVRRPAAWFSIPARGRRARCPFENAVGLGGGNVHPAKHATARRAAIAATGLTAHACAESGW